MNNLIRIHRMSALAALLLCFSTVGNAQQRGLTKARANKLAQEALTAALEAYRPTATKIWLAKKIRHENGSEMKFEYNVFGDKPADGRSLYISLHGGGNAPAEVNDKQWTNQISLYTPKEGVYVAPRAPTNTWMLWHENHIDDLFDELIKTAIVMEGVNPNKVYLLGYSAGGDGVFQLAPRMADRWAAASMMAGHPGDAQIVNLRNLPFALFMGGLDSAYNRNGLAAIWEKQLDSLQQQDPNGYTHLVRIYPENGHWMQRKDSVAVDWMAVHVRNAYPDKVIWIQDDRIHKRFYWLGVPTSEAATGKTLHVRIHNQTVDILQNDYETCFIYLNDQLVNLDKPILVTYRGKRIFRGRVKRNAAHIQTSAERLDEGFIYSAKLTLNNGKITID